jgi:KUP system potassium uptake protein
MLAAAASTAVQVSFGAVAYPSLILTYFGQASWLMHNPEGYSTLFYSCVPAPLFWPVFLISVAAAVVASQV